MKSVIVEVKDGYAAALTEDGQFIKIKDCDYVVGTELELEEKLAKNRFMPNSRKVQKISTLVASAAAALLIFFCIKSFYTPYTTVSIDVNPSIVMSANRYDLVLGFEAVNEDAEELVGKLTSESMRYKKIDTVVDAALKHISDGDYQAENGTTYVVISANSKNARHSETLADEFSTIGEGYSDISSLSVAADDDLLEKAEQANTTAGKMYLVDRLKKERGSEDFDESEWLEKPIKDIVSEIDGSGNASEKEIENKGIPEADDNKIGENDRSGSSQDIKTEDGNIPENNGDKVYESESPGTASDGKGEGTVPSDNQNIDPAPSAPEGSGEDQGNSQNIPENQNDDHNDVNAGNMQPEQMPVPNGENSIPAGDNNGGMQPGGKGQDIQAMPEGESSGPAHE